MSSRKITFENGEYYHIYNRGVDKRNIISNNYDVIRILESLEIFGVLENTGGVYEHFLNKKKHRHPMSRTKLVEIVAFNILDNHYHFILKQNVDNGISRFMQKFGNGYTKHFNEKYKRSGSLFQGPFKAIHIDSDEYLNYVTAYVNLNHFVHGLGAPDSKWGMRSSLEQYTTNRDNWKNKYFKCDIDIVRSGFETGKDYLGDAIGIVDKIIKSREEDNALALEN